MDYQKADTTLFNFITDAVSALTKAKNVTADTEKVVAILREAQLKTEELYLAGE